MSPYPSSEATMREPPTPLEAKIAEWVAGGNRPIAQFPLTRGHTAETVIFYLGPEHDAAVHRILIGAILRTRLGLAPAADMLVPVHFPLGAGPRLVQDLSAKQRALLEAIAPANISNDVFSHAGVPSDPWTRRRYLGLAPATPLEQPVEYPSGLPATTPLWRRLKEEATKARRPGDAAAHWPQKLTPLLGADGAFRVLSQCAWNAYELPAPSPGALYALEPEVSEAAMAELFAEAKERASARPIGSGGIVDNLLLRRATRDGRPLTEDDLRVFGFAGADPLKGELIARMSMEQRSHAFRTLLGAPGNTMRMALVWRFAAAVPDEVLLEAASLVATLARGGDTKTPKNSGPTPWPGSRQSSWAGRR
ncbi:MAG: hypothetical protein SFW67_36215 [Myxococcaceae bacterium]|nr:hypothetical protein [Myxococcaceae bacterium]